LKKMFTFLGGFLSKINVFFCLLKNTISVDF